VRKAPRWISKSAVFAIHELLLAEHGGASGVLDEGMLDAALAAPRNRFAYRRSDVLQLAASYAYALTQNHPFVDGNKRVALTAAGVFMELNSQRLEASEHDAAEAMRALSSGELDEAGFADWLRTCSRKMRAPRRRAPVQAKAKPRAGRKRR
jgi:death-on-curing protein